jgi:hypothetical protein
MENRPKRSLVEKLAIYRYTLLRRKALRILANKYYVDPKIVLKVVDKKFNGVVEEFVIAIQVLRRLSERLEKNDKATLADEFRLGTYACESLGRWGSDLSPIWRVREPINFLNEFDWRVREPINFLNEFDELVSFLEKELEENKGLYEGITLLLLGVGVLSYYLLRPLL